MELDELRRQWRQPDGPPILPLNLRGPFRQRSRSPIDKMRRSAWREMIGLALSLLGSVAALLLGADTYVRFMSIWMIISCLLMGFYFRRKLMLLARLSRIDQPLRGYVAQQLSSLRSLIKLYYQATMWSLAISLGIGLGIGLGLTAERISQRLAGPLLLGLGKLLAYYGLFGGLSYWVLRSFITWYLQHFYGQYLDRLEGQLRELDDRALPGPAPNFTG